VKTLRSILNEQNVTERMDLFLMSLNNGGVFSSFFYEA